MPAYNAGRYIGETLQSLYAQTYANIEIIVVNDGSTDDTLAQLEKHKRPQLTIVSQPNGGQCAAANAAYRQAKGALIKFMDADDLLSPQYIETQVRRLGQRRDALASASWGRFYNDDLSSFRLNPEAVWKDLKPIDWLVTSLWDQANMMQCALWLIPREVLDRSGLWDEQLSLINDFDFFVRVLLAANDVLYCPEAVLYYRSGISSSLSGQKTRRAYESACRSIEKGVDSMLAFEDSERVRKVSANSFQIWKYEFYPQQMDLYRKAEARIKKLGGSDYPFPAGGKTKLVASLVGWKAAKRFRRYLLTR